jgi:hypothetical protein
MSGIPLPTSSTLPAVPHHRADVRDRVRLFAQLQRDLPFLLDVPSSKRDAFFAISNCIVSWWWLQSK